jgi:hypothetical protein
MGTESKPGRTATKSALATPRVRTRYLNRRSERRTPGARSFCSTSHEIRATLTRRNEWHVFPGNILSPSDALLRATAPPRRWRSLTPTSAFYIIDRPLSAASNFCSGSETAIRNERYLSNTRVTPSKTTEHVSCFPNESTFASILRCTHDGSARLASTGAACQPDVCTACALALAAFQSTGMPRAGQRLRDDHRIGAGVARPHPGVGNST